MSTLDGINPDARVEQYASTPEILQKPDPNASKDAWVQAMRIAEKNGYKIRTRKAVGKREEEKARLQNHVLSVRVFTVPDTSHIDWTRPLGERTCPKCSGVVTPLDMQNDRGYGVLRTYYLCGKCQLNNSTLPVA